MAKSQSSAPSMVSAINWSIDMPVIFRNLRWQLAFWFIILTMTVYIIAAVLGCLIFKTAMSHFVDYELTALTNELVPVIDVIDGHPSLQRWKKNVFKGPFRYLPMIQLYDQDGKLIEAYGPPGIPILFSSGKHTRKDIQEETYHVRVHSVPLRDDHKLIGYLQLELSLKNVDGALYNFAVTMGLIAPFLLVGFGLAGYFFSSKAAKPIEESFAVLQRFMADASHELNTPISIILANAESIEADIENESVKARLATISRSAERMNSLVGDLMLLAKMENSLVLSEKSIIELDKLITTVMSDFRELFKAQSVELKENTLEPAQIFGDAESLKRLIINLLQNALKYTDKGGVVEVSLKTVGNQSRLTISDTGVGIGPESLSHIFDRFYRADPSRSRAAGGAGLGLSIVKAIVETHKGHINVESSPGVGSTFSIYLPLKS